MVSVALMRNGTVHSGGAPVDAAGQNWAKLGDVAQVALGPDDVGVAKLLSDGGELLQGGKLRVMGRR